MLKTVSSVANALGALNYKGTWDAATNTPTLASGVGTQGDYYVVSVAGTTDLDGITNWGVGDWAAFNGSVWQRVEGGADGNFVNLGVNIGASTPTTYVEVMTDGATGDDDFVNLTRLTYGNVLSLSRSSGDAVIKSDKNLILRCDSGNNQTGANTNIIFQYDGSTESARFNSAGNLAFTSGNGIDFSATAGTGTSELLDDYEEGVWTPVFSDASSGGNTATGSASGYYIKVGGLVYVTGQFENVTTTGMTGGNLLYVQGIPYTPTSVGNDIFFMGSVKADGVTNSGFVNVESVDSYAWLRFAETNGATGGHLTVSDFASGTADIFFSLCYRSIL